jgi:hypothetical protein
MRALRSAPGLGCAKTKSDLVVMPSEGRIFTFFCSQRDHKPQNSGCSHTAQRFHTARVKTSKVQNEQMFSGVPPKSGLSVCAVLEAISSGGRPARCHVWLWHRVRRRAYFRRLRRRGGHFAQLTLRGFQPDAFEFLSNRVPAGFRPPTSFSHFSKPHSRRRELCPAHCGPGGRPADFAALEAETLQRTRDESARAELVADERISAHAAARLLWRPARSIERG